MAFSSAIMMLLLLLQWLLAVVFFETVFKVSHARIADRISKLMLARIWWSLLGLLTLSQGAAGVVQFVLGVLPLGLSHVHLSASKPETEIIPLGTVLRNIPSAVRTTFQMLKPFVR